MNQNKITEKCDCLYIITAGATYLDIDAYACMVAMAEKMNLEGKNAIAYSKAPSNYSVCASLTEKGQIVNALPTGFCEEKANYIIVDVSDPEFLKDSVPLDRVCAIFDHHPGFEEYWHNRIGENSHIEFIGAAATLIYREWKNAGLEDKISHDTALLLIAAILDNTLNLTSSNTTSEDIEVFNELCKRENIGEDWCAEYFSSVQKSVEADLKNAIFSDIKKVYDNAVLPKRVAQITVWDGTSILKRLPEIRKWFEESEDSWLLNVIDIKHHHSYFMCDDTHCQKEIERVFSVQFEDGVAKVPVSYLRKEIIKKTI